MFVPLKCKSGKIKKKVIVHRIWLSFLDRRDILVPPIVPGGVRKPRLSGIKKAGELLQKKNYD